MQNETHVPTLYIMFLHQGCYKINKDLHNVHNSLGSAG